MKGTRLSTMASLLVTLTTPAAFSAVSHPTEDKISHATQTRENANAWKIPAPGQVLGRVESAAPVFESSDLLGTVVSIDPITQSPKARFGQLPLQLQSVFGGEAEFERWLKSAQSSRRARSEFARYLESQLRYFVAKNAKALVLNGLSLRWDSQRFYADKQHVFASFLLAAGDTLIEGAELTFRFTDGQLTNIVSKTFGAEKATFASFLTSPDRALQAAHAVLGPAAQLKADTVSKRFVPVVEQGRYRFEPAIRFEAVSATGDDFTIVTHVRNNEIMSWNANSIYFSAQIKGVVNQRSPRGPQATVGMPYAQAQTGSGGWFGRSKIYNGDADGVVQIPSGESARAVLSSTSFQVKNNAGAAASIPLNGDVVFDGKSNSTLAENTTFYHLNVVQAWAKQVINIDWFSRQLVANVNINDVCNAFFNGRTLNFFRSGDKTSSSGKSVSCANTGEMADVVYHEWGHGLHANTGGIRDRAFSEGIGDTVAQLITASPDVGPGFFADGRPVRNLDADYMYPPKENEREVHREGLIFGSTYYHLTQALVAKYGADVGRSTARAWFLKMLYTASQYTDSYEAVLALDADSTRADARGPNFCIINQAYARHGLATRDSSCK